MARGEKHYGLAHGGKICASEHTAAPSLVNLSIKREFPSPRPAICISLPTHSMPPTTHFKRHRLLASWPTTEWKRWSASLEMVEMPLAQVLYEPGVALNYVYFPLTSIVSLLYVMENGASAEIAVVGNEGIVGVSLFMGGESTPSGAVVQSAGPGFRLKDTAI